MTKMIFKDDNLSSTLSDIGRIDDCIRCNKYIKIPVKAIEKQRTVKFLMTVEKKKKENDYPYFNYYAHIKLRI